MKMRIKKFIGDWFGFNQEIQALTIKYDSLVQESEAKLNELSAKVSEILLSDATNKAKIIELNSLLEQAKTETELELSIVSKRPQANRWYSRQETDGQYSIDVRDFFTPYDASLPLIPGNNNDEKAFNTLAWIRQNIAYTRDKTSYGFDEYWAMPYQTLKRQIGDCEDGAMLLASILLKNGVPYYRVRVCAGSVWDGRATAGFLKLADTKYFCDKSCLSQKEIKLGIIQELKQIGLNPDNGLVNQQNLKKAWFLGTKELEKAESLFVNMLGKQLNPDKKFVKNVEELMQKENLVFTTETKIDSTTMEKIYKYYVALAIADYMENKGILDNSEKVLLHGTKDLNSTEGSAGHAYCVYCRETDNEWVVLDWCYWPNNLPIKERKKHKEEANYCSPNGDYYVWFSWDMKHTYAEEKLPSVAVDFVEE
jgi:hypothetical protein